MTKPLHFL